MEAYSKDLRLILKCLLTRTYKKREVQRQTNVDRQKNKTRTDKRTDSTKADDEMLNASRYNGEQWNEQYIIMLIIQRRSYFK